MLLVVVPFGVGFFGGVCLSCFCFGGNAQMEIVIATLIINKQLGNLVINFIMDMMSLVCFLKQVFMDVWYSKEFCFLLCYDLLYNFQKYLNKSVL